MAHASREYRQQQKHHPGDRPAGQPSRAVMPVRTVIRERLLMRPTDQIRRPHPNATASRRSACRSRPQAGHYGHYPDELGDELATYSVAVKAWPPRRVVRAGALALTACLVAAGALRRMAVLPERSRTGPPRQVRRDTGDAAGRHHDEPSRLGRLPVLKSTSKAIK